MSIYVMADLHLSFKVNKPMDIFGDNWDNHPNKIKKYWTENIKPEDTVILPGDFSWATYIEDAKPDFDFLNALPGKKILLKGNHDYWWTTLTKMREFVLDNNYENIDFLYNNAYLVEDKIIVGTRGWVLQDGEENKKMINRENERLKLSFKYGIQNFGEDKEIITFMHYPPVASKNLLGSNFLEFYRTMKEYDVKECYYGHLHGNSHKDAIEGEVGGITFHLISADYLDFKPQKIN
ncbi:MAG: metallophosphoesterase [Clostridia bacterium]|nr:metallophosphoesterase [Clostridia bacterium]